MFKRQNFEYFAEGYTLSLANYEVGNVLWKEHYLHKNISKEEMMEIADILDGILANMRTLRIDNHIKEILDIAIGLGITFYDASYIFSSKELNMPLITGDEKLRAKAEKSVKVINYKELL
jgi:predicted nucleic acid-binding protein